MAHRAGAGKLHGACRAHVVKHPACAAGTVETGEREYLAAHELAGLIGIHLSGQSGRDHGTGDNGSQHKTRKHAATPTLPSAGNA